MLETARALGELLKQGWRPKRTIIFASWDGEEYGLIGSTEWVEENLEDLRRNAIVYVNIDGAVRGKNFTASAVPSLDKFIQEVTKFVKDPDTGETVFDVWWKRQNKDMVKKRRIKDVPDTATVKIGRLGSGSDYTAFLDFAGIPSMDLRFTGSYGVYHSQLDNFYWMKNFGDPGFRYHEAMTKIVGLVLLRLSSFDYLPFDYTDYADEILKYIGEVEEQYQEVKELEEDVPDISFDKVRELVNTWRDLVSEVTDRSEALLQIDKNRILERILTREKGLPGRDWFKHRIYAPGYYAGYGTRTLPGIAESIDRRDWKIVIEELKILEGIISDLIKATKETLQAD
jgi:N-acetylated-alpha-linked acidic dipeptidase